MKTIKFIAAAVICLLSLTANAQSMMRIELEDGKHVDYQVSSITSIKWFTNEIPDKSPVGAQAVDLGLSVKWANMNIGATSMDDATQRTMNFHKELREFLIPAVESKYNTYFLLHKKMKNVNDRINVTRTHRAFGGFSMGALTTWYQLIFDCAAVKYYIPLSGDIWHSSADGKRDSYKQVAEWVNSEISKSFYKNSFKVFGYTGTDDIAGTPERNIVAALNAYAPVFRYNKPDANLFFSMRQGGKHFYGDVNQYLYFALPLLWK